MPIYASDSIQCWFYSVVEGRFESLQDEFKETQNPEDKNELIEWHKRVFYSQQSLWDECRENIQTHYMLYDYHTLSEAIMNSVDWEKLLKDLREACVLEE
jgi:hypothetical protein